MKRLYQTQASATGGRGGRATSSDGTLDIQLAIPKELGGPGGAFPNPEMLFAAGYAACFDNALAFAASSRKLRPGKTRVDASVGLGQREEGGFALSVRLVVSIPELPREQAEALLEAAHQVCPYSNAIRGNVPVDIVLL